MKSVGVISNDLLTKNRIFEFLKGKDLEAMVIHSSGNFDPQAFDVFLVDMQSPQAFVILNNHPEKCIAFGPMAEKSAMEKAKIAGCERVYGYAQFFEKILPDFTA